MKLIINADDFGLTKATNDAVFELAMLGTISSTTVMVNMPYAYEAEKLAGLPNFGIGLHFNITQGYPLSKPEDVSSLVNENGSFLAISSFKKNLRKKKIKKAEVFLELNAQFSRLENIIGSNISHIDSHQDINKQSLVSNVMRDFSKGLNRKIGIRVYNKVYTSKKRLSNPGVLNVYVYGFKRSLKEMFFRHRNKSLRNYFEITKGMLYTSKHSTRDLLKVIPNLKYCKVQPGVFEVMCHPATSIEGLSETNLLNARVEEYEILKSQEFRDWVKFNSLVTFSTLNKI